MSGAEPVVGNPGTFTMTIVGGALVINDDGDPETEPGLATDLAPAESPQCSDGVDNDDDGFTDYPEDPSCTSADDHSELVSFFVPLAPSTLSGSVDESGTVAIDQIFFPTAYLDASDALEEEPGTLIVHATIGQAPGTTSTGTLNPATGEVDFTASLRVRVIIPAINQDCVVGPLTMALTTGTTGPPAPNGPISGVGYAPDGTLTVVNNSFAAPALSATPLAERLSGHNCLLGAQLGGSLGLPAPAGTNTAVFAGQMNTIFVSPGEPDPALPSRPLAVSGTAGDGEVEVSWSPPLSPGNSEIVGYRVTASGDAGGCETDGALSCVVGGLTNGTPYTFTVVATNDQGDGPPSSPSAAVTPRTIPGAPASVTGTPGNRSVVVSWNAPASNGGAPITGYEVTSSGGAGSCTTAGALTCTVSGLTNGSPYTFTVVASNDAGPGPASAPSASVTPRTVPGRPTAVSGVPRDRAVKVSWAAPASNGGAAITGYRVTASPGGRTCSTTGARSCVVTGLKNGTKYTFTVSARNVAGTGAASARSASVTPRTVPNAPTTVKATAGSKRAAVSWKAPNNGGAKITNYEVVASPGGRKCSTKGATTCTVTKLTPGKSYTFTVRAKNVAGWSKASKKSAPVVIRR